MGVIIFSAKSSGFILVLWASLSASICRAQDLIPRAYVITPTHTNAVILTYSFIDGSILFNPALPITNATGTLSIPSFSYYHAFSFFGRSANIAATLPYAMGTFQGDVNGKLRQIYRSGLLDSIFRLSVNLKGGPAMTAKEFASWHQKTILGASSKVTAPTSQYDPTILINPGTNRWGLKPELGLSRRWGNWIFDAYAGVWFFTTNQEFFSHNQISPGVNTLSQTPIGSLEVHVSYDVKPRLWASFDWNYWYGGSRSVNGVKTARHWVGLRLLVVDSTRLQTEVQEMFNPMDHPVFLLLFTLPLFWLSSWVGASFRKRRQDIGESTRSDLTFVLGGALTLLGLIIGFTYSMAVTRYDQRKNYEEEEANAIGTEYVRADFLPAAETAKIHALLKNYLYLRILYYEAGRGKKLSEINGQIARLQSEMWAVVVPPTSAQPTQVGALVVSGMNDVLNSQGYTQAAWWNRIPPAAWILLIVISVFCNLLIGYSAHGYSNYLLLILPIALSISLFLIADIDSPRGGTIRVHPQNLESLAGSLNSQ